METRCHDNVGFSKFTQYVPNCSDGLITDPIVVVRSSETHAQQCLKVLDHRRVIVVTNQ